MDDAPPASLVLVHPGPEWKHDRPVAAQQNAAAHMAWVREQLSAGTALIGGPLYRYDQELDGDLVGVIIFALPVDEAEAVAKTDPAATAGQLTMSVHPYYPVVVADPPSNLNKQT